MPRSPKGRAAARGLDARVHFQHPFHAGVRHFTQIRSAQSKILLTVITVSTAIRGEHTLSAMLLKLTLHAGAAFTEPSDYGGEVGLPAGLENVGS